MKKEQYYNIYYKETGDYEITTNNFEKWLKENNKTRERIGEVRENKDEFIIKPVVLANY